MLKKASEKVPIAVLIGRGSKLPAIIKAANKKNSKFEIKLVVTHKSISPGIEIALKNKIPAIYFKLPNYRAKLYPLSKSEGRTEYMKNLGWFINQYKPKLLVFVGWDLVMDKNFFNFFKANIGNGYAAINLHPAILPVKKGGKIVMLPDGTSSPVLKGQLEDVLREVLKINLTYFGPTVHFMEPESFDFGEIIKREFIKIGKNENILGLLEKLSPIEDKVLTEAIQKVASKL